MSALGGRAVVSDTRLEQPLVANSRHLRGSLLSTNSTGKHSGPLNLDRGAGAQYQAMLHLLVVVSA